MSFRRHIALPSCSHGRNTVRQSHARSRQHNAKFDRILWLRHSSSSICEPRNTSSCSITGNAFAHPPLFAERNLHPADQPVTEQEFTATSKPVVHNDYFERPGLTASGNREHTYSAARHGGDGSSAVKLGHNLEVPRGLNGHVKLSDSLSRQWNMTWERLIDKLFEEKLQRGDGKAEIFHGLRRFAETWVYELTAERLQKKWKTLSLQAKINIAPKLLAGSLLHSPEQALFVLANIELGWDDFATRMRCLLYLDPDMHKFPELHSSFKNEIAKCRSPDAWPLTQFKAIFIEMLLHWSTPNECDLLIQTVQERYPFASTSMLMKILLKHIRLGDVDKCMELLPRLPENFVRDSDIHVKQNLKLLLQRDTVITSDAGPNFRILPHLLKNGLEPDPAIYNIILTNALKQDFYSVAWDLYHYLRKQNIDIDSGCYVMLLRDAFSREQVTGLDEVMTDIHRSARLHRNPYLIVYSMNIVRVISFQRLRLSSRESLTRIMGLYDRAWNRQALQPFQILGSIGKPAHEIFLPDPTPAGVAYTLWTYILVQRSEQVVDKLWQRVTDVIRGADSQTIAPFYRDTVYNGFVLFYARKLGTLVRALKVVQYMLDQEICEPTARTWSLLVCGFLRHHQVNQAANVIRMMKARGLTLNYISEDHMPHEYSLTDMASRTETELDETRLPPEIELLMADAEDETTSREARMEAEVAEDLQG